MKFVAEVKPVRVLISLVCMLSASGNLLSVFAQNTPRSGFVIVTLVSGNIAGIIATETLRNSTDSGIQQTTVAPSVLIPTASMLVRVGTEENTTGIAITNPSTGSGAVNLVLTDTLGRVVLNTIVPLGPRGQFSRFLNELLPAGQAGFSTPLLLTVSAEIPVAILALNFRGSDFSPIPLTSLSSPTPVPLIPSPATALASAGSIGGSSSLLFAQVATGAGWSTDIAIGNTSAGIQKIRMDFFASNGVSTGSITDILIPPRGVFFFSTAQAEPVLQ
jgi:hypothetical protein